MRKPQGLYCSYTSDQHLARMTIFILAVLALIGVYLSGDLRISQ
ncbi:hypothetical protein LEM8419_00339 [Neolewinella maritima]|uniref:Uncharacterized protein n=1 Tax=Neolewinella maritima TaxID=1383882 RepID=A0ABN8F4R8_9BACT|nr:hypothetical protein LEM8419_00339 [Neolewinella maritima]